MNLKNILLPISLALLTTWAVQYFIINRFINPPGNDGQMQSGQTFTAPQSPAEMQPLSRDIIFVATEPVEAKETRIETPHATYLFSNQGATLEQLTFKRVMNGQSVELPTIESSPNTLREQRCFLVALNNDTPFDYVLSGQKTSESSTQLTYTARTAHAAIEKTFTIYNADFKIDLSVTITPISPEMVQARVFFNAPHVAGIKDDIINAIHNNPKGSIQKEVRGKIDLQKAWYKPSLFGTDNRYFVHAMVADTQGFTQRGYYSLVGTNDIITILEGGPVAKATTWNLSFYFGPKEDDVMNLVDPRLEQTLDYSGMLAPISRLLLMLLKYLYHFLHNYGWAIVLMTALINLVLLPLNISGAKGMKKNAEMQKKLAYLDQRYKNDPETLARERTELMSKSGMSMISGCLPKLLQLPIFFALSRVLSSSIELYKAPFLWISDLSSYDPYYILPACITLGMIFQPTVGADPKQRFTFIAIALVFGAFASSFSAGLCLYIFVGLVLNAVQTEVQQRFGWM